MWPLLSFSNLNNSRDIEHFSQEYTRCSGFTVPLNYYSSNRVFVVRWKGRMIGGFVLGSGKTLRTFEVFAAANARESLYNRLEKNARFSEMCCFWIEPGYRKNVWLNTFVWICVWFALQAYGRRQIIFGTNSVRLAALYGASQKSELIHADRISEKRTFIFTGRRSDCLIGVANILSYKIGRWLKIKRNAFSAYPNL